MKMSPYRAFSFNKCSPPPPTYSPIPSFCKWMKWYLHKIVSWQNDLATSYQPAYHFFKQLNYRRYLTQDSLSLEYPGFHCPEVPELPPPRKKNYRRNLYDQP